MFHEYDIPLEIDQIKYSNKNRAPIKYAAVRIPKYRSSLLYYSTFFLLSLVNMKF